MGILPGHVGCRVHGGFSGGLGFYELQGHVGCEGGIRVSWGCRTRYIWGYVGCMYGGIHLFSITGSAVHYVI